MKKRRRSKKNKALTQEEIWDDSALIQSWEDAVQEYKLYHSVQARGENVEDVIREAEASSVAEDGAGLNIAREPSAPLAHEAAIAHKSEKDATMTEEAQPPYSHQDGESNPTHGPDQREGTQPSMEPTLPSGKFATMPQMVSGGNSSSQDEGLKNLMMSWYFAGYYTGLYEGQQRANQQS